MKERLPVSLLTGFLGSGKTTILNRLLKEPDMEKIAVIINEFGEIGLDHLLVEKSSEETVLLDNGCLCCVMLGDLVRTLRNLLERREKGEVLPFERVLIETTGLADPAPLIHSLMTDPVLREDLRLDGIITLVDAVNADQQMDRQIESVKQVAMADRLVLTKTDLAPLEKIAELKLRLQRLNPSAALLDIKEAKAKKLLNAGLYNPETKSLDVQKWLREESYASDLHNHDHHDHDHHHHHHEDNDPSSRHDDRIASFCITWDKPVEWAKFIDWAEMLTSTRGEDLLRLKGLVQVEGEECPLVLHAVQHLFHPPVQLAAWPDQDHRSRLIFITRDMPADYLRQSLHSFGLL